MMNGIFGRTIILGALLASAGSAAAYTTRTYPDTAIVGGTAVSKFGVTGKLDDCGYKIVDHGVSNGGDTFYFPAQDNQGLIRILTIQAGTGSNPPQLLGSLSCGTEVPRMAFDDAILVLVNGGEILHATANNVPTGFTTKSIASDFTLAISWDASLARLLRLTTTKLECYDFVNNAFVLRGSAAGSWESMAVEPVRDTICLVTSDHAQVRLCQWLSGSAPTMGGSLPGTNYKPQVTSPGTVIFGDQKFNFRNFPELPTFAGNSNYFDHTSPHGALVERYRYAEYNGGDLEIRHSIAGWSRGIAAGSPRVGFGSAYATLVAPSSVDAAVQPIYQITTEPQYDANFLNGMATILGTGEKASGALVQTLRAVGNMKLAVYRSATADFGAAIVEPLELKWQSDWMAVPNAGTVAVPFSSPIDPADGSLALVAYFDTPDVLVEDLNQQDFRGFRLLSPDGAFPASFPWSAALQRSGRPAISLVTETPLALNIVTAQGSSRVADFTSLPAIIVTVAGEFDSVDISENADFSGATNYSWRLGPIECAYTLKSMTEGSHPIYVRAKGLFQQPVVKQTSIGVDTTAPPAPVAPTDAGELVIADRTTISWPAGADSPGGSGIHYYQYEVVLNGGVIGVGSAIAPATTATVQLTNRSGLVKFRLQAVDKLGNRSPFGPLSDGIQVYSPQAPALQSVTSPVVYTNSPIVSFQYSANLHGNPAVAQIGEETIYNSPALFNPPDFETTYVSGAAVVYDMSAGPDGLRQTFHRIKTIAGVSNVIQKDIRLDRVPPESIPPVAESRFAYNGENKVFWRRPLDPEPGLGNVKCEMLLVRDDDETSSVVEAKTFASDFSSTQTFVLPLGLKGGDFRVQARATDWVGNTQGWKVTDRFEINAKALQPTITRVPPAFNSGIVNKIVSSGSTDPDGDAIVGYHYKFWRTSPLPGIVVMGDELLPGQIKKGEQWYYASGAIDARGSRGWETQGWVTIANGLPTEPVVQILPRTPQSGHSLIVDVEVYSVDPDGDEVAYEFRWSKSSDNGATWIRKSELTGSFVDGLYIRDGELWKVEYLPYEKSTAKAAKRVDGKAAVDIVRVGTSNRPPDVNLGRSFLVEEGSDGRLQVRTTWSVSDPDGETVTLDLYLTDQGVYGLIPVVSGLSGNTRVFDFDVNTVPGSGPYYLYLIATDSVGNTTRVFDPTPIKLQNMTAGGWMLE